MRKSARRLPVGGRDVRDAILGLAATGVALLLASWFVPGLTISPWWAGVVLAAVVAVADALLRRRRDRDRSADHPDAERPELVVVGSGNLGLTWFPRLPRARPPGRRPLDLDLLDHSIDGEALLYGAEAVHRQLVRWLERCGARLLATPQDLGEAPHESTPADSV